MTRMSTLRLQAAHAVTALLDEFADLTLADVLRKLQKGELPTDHQVFHLGAGLDPRPTPAEVREAMIRAANFLGGWTF